MDSRLARRLPWRRSIIRAVSGSPSRFDLGEEPAFETLARGGLRGAPEQTVALLQDAWDELDAWISVAMRSLRVPTHLREDCAQEVWLRLWRARGSYRGESVGELRTWIYRISQREFYRLLDAARRKPLSQAEGAQAEDEPERELAVSTELPDEPLGEEEDKSALAACIRALEERLRQVIELLYSERAPSEREVAGMVGVSKSQVNVLRQKALASLAQCLRQKGVVA